MGITRRDFIKGLAFIVSGVSIIGNVENNSINNKKFYSVPLAYSSNPCAEIMLLGDDRMLAEKLASQNFGIVNYFEIADGKRVEGNYKVSSNRRVS